MSAFDKRVQDLAKVAFQKIAEIASSGKAANAAHALAVIEKIASAVQSAFRREITPAELAKMIEDDHKALIEGLAANKKTIMAELDAKFPPK